MPAADLAGRPDLIEKEASRLMLQFRKLVGDITYIHTREGFVYPAGRDGAATRKELLATPWQGRMRVELVQNAPEKWRCGTVSPSRV